MSCAPLDPARARAAVLAWYDENARALAWRTPPGARDIRPDPYRVWLSEVMLQQTTVAAVEGYFARFLARFPDVFALAAAPLEEVLSLWAGLGYYARARNLHACAKAVAAAGGRFPQSEAALRGLPGVGPYTAAAIAAIAFDAPANVVDGNVERVMARLYAVDTPLPDAKPELRARAGALADPARPGDYAQALMDLGAMVCVPRAPKCALCPWTPWCAAHASGAPERYPKKRPKPERPQRYGVAFYLARGEEVLLRRRPAKGLLGAMAELPTTPWRIEPWDDDEVRPYAPVDAEWRGAGAITHVFTHFKLDLAVWRAEAPPGVTPAEGWWAARDALAGEGLPSVMAKAARAGGA